MQFSTAFASTLLLTGAALVNATPETTATTKLAARDFSASEYQTQVTGSSWTNSWWDQSTCAVNQQASTWSWFITVDGAKSVDGNSCGQSYMNKIKATCNGPLLAWSCRYVGADQTTAWIDINADQSCTPSKVSSALGSAGKAMTCSTYKDSFGAGTLEPMGTFKSDIAWDFLSWW